MKKESEISLFGYLFILLVTLSTIELFGYNLFTSNLTDGSFSDQKPSWALVTVIVILLHEYRDILYMITIPVAIIFIGNTLYQQFRRQT